MATRKFRELVFKHLVELDNSRCTFCSTEEKWSGRRYLFLVFKEEDEVYERNGLKGTWEKVDEEDAVSLRAHLQTILSDMSVPRFRTLRPDMDSE